MNTIKSLIIDDDPFIQDLLMDKLKQYIPHVEVLATAGSGTEGITLIEKLKPELIFLDVEMADMTGFEMLSRLQETDFQTIFITSYSHYAIKAFRFNALDYLVKPIDLGDLKESIKRFQKRKRKNHNFDNIKHALYNLKTTAASQQKLYLQTQEGGLQFTLKNIIRIEADRNYSYIYSVNKKKKLTSKTLADLEELLKDKGFFRCHKSHLINYSHIKEVPNSISILLSDETTIPIARRKKESFKKWWDSFKTS